MGARMMEELTLWQLRYLCKHCDCWNCGFGVTVPADLENTFQDTRECTIRRPRDWPVYFDDRTTSLADMALGCWRTELNHKPCLFEDCCDCGIKLKAVWYTLSRHSIPIPWRMMLWDEMERLDKLREDPK